MPEENVELVKSWFERWNAGDRFSDEELHPEVELITQLQPVPLHGHNGFRTWIAEIDEQFKEWRLVIEEWHDAGDGRVVAIGHIHLVGHGSGVELDQPLGWIIEIEDEKLRRMRTYREHSAALEAAGLAE